MRFDRLGYKEKSTGLANCIRYVNARLIQDGITPEVFSDTQLDYLRNKYIDKYLLTLDYNCDGSINTESKPTINSEIFEKESLNQKLF